MNYLVVISVLLLLSLSTAVESSILTDSNKYNDNNNISTESTEDFIHRIESESIITHLQFTYNSTDNTTANTPNIANIINKANWNEFEALRYVNYAMASYTDNLQHLQHWQCGQNCQLIPQFELTDIITDKYTETLVYLGINRKYGEIIIAYRGTHNINNIWEDLKILKTNQAFAGIKGAYTATGFYGCYIATKSAVITAVNKLKSTNSQYRIKIIGHSLGGAVATIAALDMKYSLGISVECYSLGSPRVGNDGFVFAFESANIPQWRLTHSDDPIPHLPFELLGFKHINNEVYQSDINEYTFKYLLCTVTSAGEDDPNCSANHWWIRFDIMAHLRYMGIEASGENASTSISKLSINNNYTNKILIME